ncbi:MAG: PEP-CTERM sorting domain-containing protein [Rubrivivax sp.]|nr:PEP-CTERM sorting domain-containing protein [Rubrivivax sp.]
MSATIRTKLRRLALATAGVWTFSSTPAAAFDRCGYSPAGAPCFGAYSTSSVSVRDATDNTFDFGFDVKTDALGSDDYSPPTPPPIPQSSGRAEGAEWTWQTNFVQLGSGVASGWAESNLRSGTLKGFVETSGSVLKGAWGSAGFVAGIADVLLFQVPTSVAQFDIDFGVVFDGSITTDSPAPLLSTAQVSLYAFQVDVGRGVSTEFSASAPGSYGGLLERTLTVLRTSTVGDYWTAQVAIDFDLKLTAYPDAYAHQFDFSNTARLQFSAPDDLAYTSASGVFLTPVPEPSSAWLLGIGLLAFRIKRALLSAPMRCA